MSEWISVDNRMPDRHGRKYLVKGEYGVIACACYLDGGRGWLSSPDQNKLIPEVTHWCPIPEFDCPEPESEWTLVVQGKPPGAPRDCVIVWVKRYDGHIRLAYLDRHYHWIDVNTDKKVQGVVESWRSLTVQERYMTTDELLLMPGGVVKEPELERCVIQETATGCLRFERRNGQGTIGLSLAVNRVDFFGYEYADGHIRPAPLYHDTVDPRDCIPRLTAGTHAEMKTVRPVAVLFRRAKA